jgi:hypothetical protein
MTDSRIGSAAITSLRILNSFVASIHSSHVDGPRALPYPPNPRLILKHEL